MIEYNILNFLFSHKKVKNLYHFVPLLDENNKYTISLFLTGIP